MRIVQIEDDFHPEAGYQINILSKYLVDFGHEVYILTSEMEKVPTFLKEFFGTEGIEEKDRDYSEKYNVKIIRLPVHCFVGTRAVFTSKCRKTIAELKPDVLYIHGNDTLTAIRLLYRRRSLGCAIIMDSHMLGMASKNRFSGLFHLWYKVFVAPIIKKEHITVIRTQKDDYVQRELGIPLEMAPWISYGSDTMIFRPGIEQRKRFREEQRISEDAFLVCYVGKLDEYKKGLFFAEAIREPLPGGREIVFVIVGNVFGEYGRSVEEILGQSGNRILRFPTQSYGMLPKFFQASDLVVFPAQCSLSFYDAQACGVPVLSEDNNINVDRCSHGNGRNFVADDVESFRRELVRMAAMDKEAWKSMSDNALNYIKNNFDYREKAREYERCIIETLK